MIGAFVWAASAFCRVLQNFLNGSYRSAELKLQGKDFVTMVEGDRIDLLAHRYLCDARLWWIICDYNDIFFPLELTPGTDLRIPSVEHVQMRLLD